MLNSSIALVHLNERPSPEALTLPHVRAQYFLPGYIESAIAP